MIFTEALLAGFVGVSLCMANISGIVTDTNGITPVAGAIVQLENGGQKDTTKADGSFTLLVGSTDILPSNSKLPLNILSARISNDMMTITMLENSAIEIAAFDFSGKSVFTIRKTLEVGSQKIALPQQGARIYLYKVKVGNRQLMVKGNMVGGVSNGFWAVTQGTSSKSLLKQAKTTATISDVIVVTKDGKLNYRCAIGIDDTSGVVIKMIENAGNVTDKDGNIYQSVRIGNQVWMTENLRVKGTLSEPDSISKKYGVLYNWYFVKTGMLIPQGWHVPTDAEWDILLNYLIAKGYNWDGTTTGNKVAKSLAAKADWNIDSRTGTIGYNLSKNNSSGFSALPGSCADFNGGFYGQINNGIWWSATAIDDSSAWCRSLDYTLDYVARPNCDVRKNCGFFVRLVRDN